MNRRKFSKITLTAATGLVAIPGLANTFKMENTNIRLGGPVFKKYSNPEEWISALIELNYKAAYCPVQLDASFDDIKSYKNASSDILNLYIIKYTLLAPK